MAVRRLTVKNIISRIRQTFPEAPETYLYNLINDALFEAGLYRTKVEYAKATIFTEKLSKLGLKPQVIFESTCAPKALAKIKA